MKKIIAGLALFALGALFTFNSCKNPGNTSIPSNAMAVINKDPSLSIFSTIADFSGDENYINNCAAIIIPVDSAFLKAGITAKVVATFSGPECDSIVMYYTVFDGINFNASAGKEIGFSSGLGPLLFGDSTNSNLYFDGISTVSPAPIRAGHSSIFKLKQMINLPSETVSQIAAADTTLSFFNAAFDRTGLADKLADASFTLLMPTNNAFRRSGYPDIKSIYSANINTLTSILKNQAIPKNYFQNDLEKQNEVTTLLGKPIRVIRTHHLKLIGSSHPNASACLLNNGMLAANVLTYKTNGVLLP